MGFLKAPDGIVRPSPQVIKPLREDVLLIKPHVIQEAMGLKNEKIKNKKVRFEISYWEFIDRKTPLRRFVIRF